MSEWKEYKLGEIVVLNYGKALAENKRISGNVPVYSSAGITGWHNEPLVNSEGLIIGRKGTIGKVYYSNTPFFCIDTAYYILPNEKIYDLKFLFYKLKTVGFEDLNEDSAVPGLNRETAYNQEVLLPQLPEQKAIASVLSSLDDKIDLLHRQNSTLEKMAETLFRQWFIEEAKEREKTKIGLVLETVLGGTPSTKKPEYWDGTIPWINSGEVNNFRILKPTKFITELGLAESNTKLLPIGTTVLAITGATLGQISLLEISTCANQSVVGIIPNETYPKEYVFLWIKYMIDEIILNETGGAQPHINKNDVNETEILVPCNDDLEFIESKIKPLFKKISINSFQINTLIELRDSLLPKLMSGEITVNQG